MRRSGIASKKSPAPSSLPTIWINTPNYSVTARKQWLEIGMLLIQEPALMMLDEPVAGMSVSERKKTVELLHQVIQHRAVLVIEHDMGFVEEIAHKVTVLDRSRVLSEGSVAHVKADPKVVGAYLGH
jgi:urea transport system ATP-binding protein